METIETSDLKTLEPVLRRAKVCRIGLSLGDMPYVVPMNFGYADGCVYLHSSPEGKKIDILKENDNVCFEVDIDHEFVESETACNWGIRYRSIIGFGKAFPVTDPAEKLRALDTIVDHYSDSESHEYQQGYLSRVAVFKIELESVTAKLHGYQTA
jgi:nitroimidazol reductase NimA-like FMN-containing flavoprotein (pyridoxamine 5'-phosphate oxidase superfamily)